MLCVAVRTNSNFALYIINRVVFITEVESVYCEVHTEILYNAFGKSLCKVLEVMSTSVYTKLTELNNYTHYRYCTSTAV
jgi:hypothetical protein